MLAPDVAGDEPAERRDGNFLDPPDAGGAWTCDRWAQDCPTGHKCAPWANDGGSSWNAWKCVPLDPDPDDVGEPCTVVGSAVSGIDSCGLGSMCLQEVCTEFCQGSEANPTCPDPTLHCVGRDVMLCMPNCCPLEQSCHEGEGCYPTNDAFSCVPHGDWDDGAFGDPCEYVNVCDPGLFCADAERVPGCKDASGCCAPYCEIGSDTCSAYHPDLACVPWFEPGHAPFGEEHVGGCLLPEPTHGG